VITVRVVQTQTAVHLVIITERERKRRRKENIKKAGTVFDV